MGDDEEFGSTETPWPHDTWSHYNMPSSPDLFDVLRTRSDINVAGARGRGNNIDINPDEEEVLSTAARASSTSRELAAVVALRVVEMINESAQALTCSDGVVVPRLAAFERRQFRRL